ncbi:MAG: TonB-dependent receptor [Rikenellaceae bacterium]
MNRFRSLLIGVLLLLFHTGGAYGKSLNKDNLLYTPIIHNFIEQQHNYNYTIDSIGSSDFLDSYDSPNSLDTLQKTKNTQRTALSIEEFGTNEPLVSANDIFGGKAQYLYPYIGYNGRSLPYSWNEITLQGIKLNSLRSNYAPFWAINSRRINDYNTSAENTPKSEIGKSSALSAELSAYQNNSGYASTKISSSSDSYTLAAGYQFSAPKSSDWAYAFDIAKKWGRSLLIDGIFSDSYNFSFCTEGPLAKDNRGGTITLTAIVNPTQRSRSRATTAEAYSLAGDNQYNPLWGMQNGKQRSTRVNEDLEPTITLSHSIAPTQDLKIESTLSTRFGRTSYTALSWQGVANPMPDYYAYMPSYQSSTDAADLITESWSENIDSRQLDFTSMYATNNETSRANYIIEERITEPLHISAKTKATWRDFSLALSFAYQSEYCYKELNSLLGGGYWLDIDSFLEQDNDTKDMTENNLQDPGRYILEGEKFGYSYRLDNLHTAIEASHAYKHNNLYLYSSASLWLTTSQRIGYYEKENFSGTESLGISSAYCGISGSLFSSLRWLVTNKLTIEAELGIGSYAPTSNEIFINVGYRNSFRTNLSNSLRYKAEASTEYLSDNLRLQGELYYYKETGGISNRDLYDDMLDCYAHYNIWDIETSRLGLELGAEVRLYEDLWIEGTLTLQQNKYDNNPTASLTQQSSGEVLIESEEVYYSGYYLGGTPQSVGTLSLNYNPYGWNISLTALYSGGIYEELSPLRYTSRIIGYTSEESYSSLRTQQKYEGGIILNLSGGYSLELSESTSLWLWCNIQNILNKDSIVKEVYQSDRFFTSYDTSSSYSSYSSLTIRPSLLRYSLPMSFSIGAYLYF